MSALSACRVSYSGCRLGPVTGIDWRTSSRICRARWRWTLSKKFIKQVLLEAKTLRKLTTLITDGRMDCETNARMDRVFCNKKYRHNIHIDRQDALRGQLSVIKGSDSNDHRRAKLWPILQTTSIQHGVSLIDFRL